MTIRGRSATIGHSGYQRVYNEYSDGDYERVFTLSENIDGFDFALSDAEMDQIFALASANGRLTDFGFAPKWD